jgi:hypothetical protein
LHIALSILLETYSYTIMFSYLLDTFLLLLIFWYIEGKNEVKKEDKIWDWFLSSNVWYSKELLKCSGHFIRFLQAWATQAEIECCRLSLFRSIIRDNAERQSHQQYLAS